MEKEIKKKLEGGLSESVKEYVDINLMDADKVKALNVLSKEIKIINEEDSSKINDELRKERQAFEIVRGKEQLKLEQSKTKLEEKKYANQVKNDSAKLLFEKTKFGNEDKLKKAEFELNKTKHNNEFKKVEQELKLNKEKFEYEKKKEDARLKIEEVKAQLERDKFNCQLIQEDNKISLEKEKLAQTLRLEEAKLNLEADKLKLEYAKLEIEKAVKLSEEKKEKRSFFANIGIKTLEIGIPTLTYFALAIMNLRLVYKDDGIIPSTMKDFMKKI